ncbi:MAG: hypothetical protein EZS28_014108 [Streblomastix strix]|uniref:Uncharacterized protein n=1 Tax=Streblomastix strix TaxID=222440 RepID=A0A5J4W6T5_9EUKA|nr:MAG: hypothetical protein EZS28_014108 [Streblomastix strix]
MALQSFRSFGGGFILDTELCEVCTAQPQPTFVNAFRKYLQIDPLEPEQTIAKPEEVPPNAITAARFLLAGFLGQEASQIDFYAEKQSEEQVVEARQRARAATVLVTRRKPPKHNIPPAQPMLAFDQVLADLETKLLQQYRLLQGTLTQIVNMTRALMDKTEQGNLLKTQPSPVIRPAYNNQILRSLRALPRTDGALLATVGTLLTRIVGFTGELDQELKKLTAQQQSLNPYAPPNPFYNQPPQQQIQVQQPPQYPFQYSGQPIQYPIYPVQFPTIPPSNPFKTTVNPPQTQMSEPRLPTNETVREQQSSSLSSQQMEQASIQTVERSRQSTTSIRNVHNLLIPPIPAYTQQQTPRMPLLPYTTERNQQQRQSQRSISPSHKKADESEDDEFLDEVIPGMKIPHFPPHMSDIETAQRTQQNRGYDLVRDPSVIKYKNSKWHSKLATQKPFTFRDWIEFWSDVGFSLEQINIPHYLSEEYKSQSLHDKSRGNESIWVYEREKQQAINNGKGVKRPRFDEQLSDAEAKKKQNSSSSRSCSSSSSQEIQEDWTGKGNKEIPRTDGDEDWLEDDERHEQMEKERQIEFDKIRQAKNQQQSQPRQLQMEKDPEVNENQVERRSEPKNPISLIRSDQNTQANPNIDLNYISPQHSIPHKPSSPHLQQHSQSPSLEETLAILRIISPGAPLGYKEKEPEPKQQKLQQYPGLMDVIERFQEIMKPIIEEEKKKPKIMLPGQYKHYPNKDGPLFFYPPKNYQPTPITRPKDLDLSEEQWKQFDGDVRYGVVPYCL